MVWSGSVKPIQHEASREPGDSYRTLPVARHARKMRGTGMIGNRVRRPHGRRVAQREGEGEIEERDGGDGQEPSLAAHVRVGHIGPGASPAGARQSLVTLNAAGRFI